MKFLFVKSFSNDIHADMLICLLMILLKVIRFKRDRTA